MLKETKLSARVKISKANRISGETPVPPSKSAAHRALICGALAGGGEVEGIINSYDMIATSKAVFGLGADISFDNDRAVISRTGIEATNDFIAVNCIESGSTLRFLIPVYAALGINAEFVGEGRLPSRPIGIYNDILPSKGVRLVGDGGLPLKISGKLKSGVFKLPGNISSQFISGLIFALPLCNGDSEIILTSKLESASYVAMTIDAVRKAGIVIEEAENGYKIKGNQKYIKTDFKVEGDWSQGAFLLVMGAIAPKGSHINVHGLNLTSKQGDKEIYRLLEKFGADIKSENNIITIKSSRLKGIKIDATQIPDLVPILSVLGMYAEGETQIYGAERLRIKESDRLRAMADNINKIGGNIRETEDGLIIKGGTKQKRSKSVVVSGYNDHRIVMSMAVAGVASEVDIIIEQADSVAKSWPNFFEVYKNCGGVFDVF